LAPLPKVLETRMGVSYFTREKPCLIDISIVGFRNN
jgi:hypothetical protein